MPEPSVETLRALARSPLLRGIDESILARLDPPPERIAVRAGDTVVEQGQRGTDYFVLLSGRLRVVEQLADGSLSQVGHVLPGEGIGEESLFTGAPSPVTVVARLDSTLVRFPQAMFLVLVAAHPMTALNIAATVIDRARGRSPNRARALEFPAVAVVSLSPSIDATSFAHGLAQALNVHAPSEVMTPVSGVGRERDLPDGVITIAAAGPAADTWAHERIIHADLVLFAADVTTDDRPGGIEREIVGRIERHVLGRTDLVLVHPPDWAPHCGAARWIDRLKPDEHHHVRAGNRADLARLARIVLGRSNNVVFSGGGARAFSQIGVMRALEEFGIPIDRVGGTSMGAAMAAIKAVGDDFDGRVRQVRDLFRRRQPGRDYTLPVLSLLAGKRMNSIGMDMFNPWQIEDLPLRFFCVSSDLGRGELIEHFRGPLWMAIRATASMPVVAPPFAREGRLLVDGGVLNNLPVDVMSRHFAGRLIAVDASEHRPLTVDPYWELACPSGLDVLRRNLNPFRPAASVPNILEILRRTATLASERQALEARRAADLLVVPPVSAFGFTDFDAFDTIVECGYRHTVAQLEARERDHAARPS